MTPLESKETHTRLQKQKHGHTPADTPGLDSSYLVTTDRETAAGQETQPFTFSTLYCLILWWRTQITFIITRTKQNMVFVMSSHFLPPPQLSLGLVENHNGSNCYLLRRQNQQSGPGWMTVAENTWVVCTGSCLTQPTCDKPGQEQCRASLRLSYHFCFLFLCFQRCWPAFSMCNTVITTATGLV